MFKSVVILVVLYECSQQKIRIILKKGPEVLGRGAGRRNLFEWSPGHQAPDARPAAALVDKIGVPRKVPVSLSKGLEVGIYHRL